MFWLLGAIDGHAKNFSIFLKQGGRFKLTPIYDVMSAYPLAEKHQLDYQRVKMAMALHGKNTHYHWQNIRPRHWFAEAKRVGFPASQMEEIIEQTHSKLDKVIDIISTKLPNTFPENISQAIFQGMKKAAAKL
ncbi:MAG: HipA domain-containing protein [Xanthomonadales bacterium]|nr:HipA domain-containing protein [Xanthomonadales bacterium]